MFDEVLFYKLVNHVQLCPLPRAKSYMLTMSLSQSDPLRKVPVATPERLWMVQRMPYDAKPTLSPPHAMAEQYMGEAISWIRGIVCRQLACNGGGDLLIPV